MFISLGCTPRSGIAGSFVDVSLTLLDRTGRGYFQFHFRAQAAPRSGALSKSKGREGNRIVDHRSVLHAERSVRVPFNPQSSLRRWEWDSHSADVKTEAHKHSAGQDSNLRLLKPAWLSR